MSLIRRMLVVTALLSAGGVLAQQSRPVDKRSASIEGTVEQGPCTRALTLRAKNGERFEIDPTRTALKAGDRGTYSGTVYPRISICNSFAWLDISSSNNGSASTPTAQAPRVNPAEQETTVMLVSSRPQLDARLREAKDLKSKLPAQVKVVVGLRGAQAPDAQAQWKALAATLIELKNNNDDPDLLTGIAIQVIEPSTPDGLIQQSAAGERFFPTVAAFIDELNRESRRPM
jgi:hypothetical protein